MPPTASCLIGGVLHVIGPSRGNRPILPSPESIGPSSRRLTEGSGLGQSALDLAEVAARAADLTDERELADLRAAAAEEIEQAVRGPDFRIRAMGYRAIGPLRFRQKVELLRRGLEDESPACRGAALISLELLSRDQPGDVNAVRPMLHTLANSDPNGTVRRLAVMCLKNGSPSRDSIVLLEHIAEAEDDRDLRTVADRIAAVLRKRASQTHSRDPRARQR